MIERLFKEVLDRPWDTEVRRVYADALNAEGDPRGEFIAVQLALEEREDEALRERADELVMRYGHEWIAPLRGVWLKMPDELRPSVLRGAFHRGFIENADARDDLDGLSPKTPIARLTRKNLRRHEVE